jgi:hypothetical protein
VPARTVSSTDFTLPLTSLGNASELGSRVAMDHRRQAPWQPRWARETTPGFRARSGHEIASPRAG